jgi:restriction system protein
VREIGDSGTIEEIVEKVIELEGFTEEQQAVQHADGPASEIEYRLAWARTYLKGMGALDNSKRGVWSTTESGRAMTPGDVLPRHAEYVAHLREARRAKKAAKVADEDDPGSGGEDGEGTRDWKEQLIEELLATSPDRFERLARRLLREAGFISATVTGKSGDGGIDGIGVYRLSLVSFPVFFQCKRYKGSVGAGAVRDFRGAMSGRGDKGLLITTGSFTADAKQEATRDGAPPRGTGAVASRASLTTEGPPPWRPPRHDRRMKHVYGRTTLPLALITPCTASGVAFCWHLPLMIG